MILLADEQLQWDDRVNLIVRQMYKKVVTFVI
jgi:hypothetical protein